LISIFRSYQPAIIFLLLLYLIFFRLVLFLEPVTFQPPQTANLLSNFSYHALSSIATNRNWVYHVVSILLVFLQALYFNYLVNFYRILSRSSYLAAFSYILVSSLFVEFTLLTSALMANTFLLIAIGRIFSLYKKDSATAIVFDAAWWVSIASLFFFPYIVFFVFVVAAITVLRPFNAREYFLAAIGLLLPYYFMGVYFFWIDKLPEFLHSLIISELRFNTEVLERSSRILVVGIPLVAVILWTALFIQANLFRMVVQVRNYLIVIVWFFVAGILSLLVQFKGDLSHFIWLTIPAGISFAFFFAEFRKRLVSEILHFFIILAILFYQYFYLFN
jgi:hypothetical protein